MRVKSIHSIKGGTEAQFQSAVIKLAHDYRWRVMHCHDCKRVPKSAIGYPDLTLHPPARLRHKGVLYRELKTVIGRATIEQAQWGEYLLSMGHDWTIWTPDDWTEIRHTLSGET